MSSTTTILFFGKLTDIVGNTQLNLPLIKDTEELTQLLFERYPVLQEMKFAISVNKQIVHSKTTILPNVEVALLPPFSGG